MQQFLLNTSQFTTIKVTELDEETKYERRRKQVPTRRPDRLTGSALASYLRAICLVSVEDVEHGTPWSCISSSRGSLLLYLGYVERKSCFCVCVK